MLPRRRASRGSRASPPAQPSSSCRTTGWARPWASAPSARCARAPVGGRPGPRAAAAAAARPRSRRRAPSRSPAACPAFPAAGEGGGAHSDGAQGGHQDPEQEEDQADGHGGEGCGLPLCGGSSFVLCRDWTLQRAAVAAAAAAEQCAACRAGAMCGAAHAWRCRVRLPLAGRGAPNTNIARGPARPESTLRCCAAAALLRPLRCHLLHLAPPLPIHPHTPLEKQAVRRGTQTLSKAAPTVFFL